MLFDELLDEALVLDVFLGGGGHGGRAGDDERGAGFVDEDGVYFVNNGEVVAALNLLAGRSGHAVVAQGSRSRTRHWCRR